jgi:hypothetical protein
VLRIAGIVAVILSSILAAFVFTRVKTVSASGHFYNWPDRSYVWLETAERTKNVFDRGMAPAYPGTFGAGSRGSICVNVEVPFPSLPESCDVEIRHRSITLGARAFTSTVLRYEGTNYPMERSPGMFFGTLSLIALAPIVLWGLVALLSVLLVSPSPSTATK